MAVIGIDLIGTHAPYVLLSTFHQRYRRLALGDYLFGERSSTVSYRITYAGRYIYKMAVQL